MARSLLAVAIVGALATGLAACGGGNSKSTPPVAPTSPPTSPPTTSPPPLVQPPTDAHLTLTHATAAERQGYTGAGYRIGVIDSGVNRNHPALAGRVLANLNYVNTSTNDMSVDDKVGHGTTVAQLAAGAALGTWPGGVAPGASILSARIINDERPTDDGSGQGNEVTGAIGIKSINQDLATRGMRIMNNSWGGLYWTRTSATAPIADEYRFFIQDYDGLVVFATGNESRADPTNMAALPSQPGPGNTLPAADLEQGWLAVAALDTSNPTELMYYSNACGLAMNYCLVAPGTVVFSGHNDTADNITFYYGSGTSYAAPLVSGAAAVLWEKFPYFNNDLIRQTLLGNATDLGDPGVDAVFGYGLLNLGKALGGPSQFNWGDVTVDFSGSSTWSNGITGDGGLVKRGSGTLTLGNAGLYLDYRGDTRIEGGTLSIQGDLHYSDVTVAAGGRLAGTTWLGADLSNAGVVQIDDASAGRGGFTVEGNYVQKAGGRLSMILGYGQLLVDGTATIEGGDVHVSGVRSGYVAQAREYVLTADGGLTGRFSGVGAASSIFLDATLGYSANSAWMDITRLDVSVAAASLADITPAAIGAAQRVEAAFDGIDAQQDGGHGSIDDGFIRIAGDFQQITRADTARASLRSLSGEVHAAALAATFDTMDLGRRTLSTRFDALASGGQRTGAWMEGLAGSGSAGTGADAQYSGWLAGQDFAGDGAIAGLAFGETRSDSRFDGLVDRSRERQAQAQLYLGRQWGQGYVLGRFGAGQWQRQIDRQLLLGASSFGLHSDYDGDFSSAGLEAGYRFDAGGVALVPYLVTEHARVASDGFREAGAAGFGLRNDGNVASRSQAIAGLRLQRAWGAFELDGYAEWQQTLASDGLSLSASFVGVDAWSPLAATDPALSGGLFGVAARAWLTPRSALSFGYDQRFGPRGDAGMASLRYAVGF
ncbi:S8 family serine peptidase [Pseudoxanthomonas koreensis]|uniref:S8 family serine peptidase n=1 Tax=Pseudoxanthomonas koreensis TaxID=266061 RepID=UPI001390B93E|nr:S8 family serine peptidase [Pseudoxanthomonas koreensis]KAF1697647.1 autotransporter domain-containing protein [Pseudoxanthomonas koreensis]